MSYQYKISYSTRSRFVQPAKDGKITLAKEDGEMFFRAKLTGSMELSGEDYDFLQEAKTFSVKCCQQISVTIYKTCAAGGQKIAWEGEFGLGSIGWDFDNRTATIQKINVKDAYTEVFANWFKPINLLDYNTFERVALDTQRSATDTDYNPSGSNYHSRCMDFIEVLRYMIRRTFRLSSRQDQVSREELSTFFSAATNPVTGKMNIFKDVFITHLSDLKRPDASNPATEGKISLKDMLNAIKLLFNVYWFVDEETGFIRLEHISFFPHLSYGAAPVTLDLTQDSFKEALDGKKGYTSDESEIFATEGLEMALNKYDGPGAYSADAPYNPGNSYKAPPEMAGVYYLYGNECVPMDAKGERTENIKVVPNFFTDVLAARVYPAAIADDGWSLLHAPMQGRIRTVKSKYLPLSNESVQNGELSPSVLFRDYHRYNVSFSYGSMADVKDFTGKPMPSKSVKLTQKFTEFELSNCCGSEYNFSGVIRHPYGSETWVTQLEYDLQSETITVSLMAARECDVDIPETDDDRDTGEGNGCPAYGTVLRTDEQLFWCPAGARRQLHKSVTTTYYADGQCGEYNLGGVTKIIKEC